MKTIVLVLFVLMMMNQTVLAATASDGGALALASLIAEHSPLLTANEKKVMALMLNGDLSFSFPVNKKISVQADNVVCRASDVDITFHSCDLAFGKKMASLKGRNAHELFATLKEVDVASEGAAGTIFESLSQLACTIDPNEVKQKDGGGAECTFNPGAP
jgi:hypothetical protein